MKYSLLQKSLAELIGTFALVFFGCGSIVLSQQGGLPPLLVPMIFGSVIAIMIYALGHISGAHFNPAVTFSFAFSGYFPRKEVVPYWLGQFAGGVLAVSVLYFLIPDITAFGATLPSVPVSRALIWETLLSFFLMLVIVSVATDSRVVGSQAGIAIGGVVMICAFIGGPFTGASMNPARTLAPNLFQAEFTNLWIYFAGPLIGATLAAIVYGSIRCQTKTENSSGPKGCC